MFKARGFEIIEDSFRHTNATIKLPQRATRQSAGYDFFSPVAMQIWPGTTVYIPTDVKAYMLPDEVLQMYPRSSQGIKLHLMLANTTGIIDADYYDNPENDGHIGIFLRNLGTNIVQISRGDKIAQGVFVKYLKADNDPDDLPERTGGTGSTGR